ncbi:MAG: TIGR04013 family B12-binding domain/radical SAM domain-containing protein, partial [Deltaproteobacteria bacterium]
IRVHHFLPLPGSDLGDLEPSPIAEDVAREIGRMSQRGLFTGSFFQQMEMAKRIRRGKRA